LVSLKHQPHLTAVAIQEIRYTKRFEALKAFNAKASWWNRALLAAYGRAVVRPQAVGLRRMSLPVGSALATLGSVSTRLIDVEAGFSSG
jgi:hypothetical protein